VLRRHPEGKWRKKESIIEEFQKIQLSILSTGSFGKNVSSLLKPEGRLVYCTCSTEPEEGEEVIERFLKDNPDFYLEEPSLDLPEGIIKNGFFRVYPHIHGTDGFFAAMVGKT
jgi:16S rRNA (cytosine967-C5)-methyltransferase